MQAAMNGVKHLNAINGVKHLNAASPGHVGAGPAVYPQAPCLTTVMLKNCLLSKRKTAFC